RRAATGCGRPALVRAGPALLRGADAPWAGLPGTAGAVHWIDAKSAAGGAPAATRPARGDHPATDEEFTWTSHGGRPAVGTDPRRRRRPRSALQPEPALPRGVGTDRTQEVDLPEAGPVRLAEVELRVRALPQQEAAQALLPRRA